MGSGKPEPLCAQSLRFGILRPYDLCHFESAASLLYRRSSSVSRRNRSMRDPAAMKQERLTGDTGAGLDPCAAVQLTLELEPGESAEVTFLLGQAPNETEARALVQRFRDPSNVEATLQETRAWWGNLLDTIQVETPEASANAAQSLAALSNAKLSRLGPLSLISIERCLRNSRSTSRCHGAGSCCAADRREQILRAAARQFVEGDIQHWWLPVRRQRPHPNQRRSALAAVVTAHYMRVTGDGAPAMFEKGGALRAEIAGMEKLSNSFSASGLASRKGTTSSRIAASPVTRT